MLDIDYEQGLKKLRDIVQRQKPEIIKDFLLFEWRLVECLERGRRYGQSSDNDAQRIEILDRLIHFTSDHFGIEFIELCRSNEKSANPSPKGDAPPLPGNLRVEVWVDGDGIFVKGIKYIIYEPVEIVWSSDKSALKQQARALQTDTGRLVWLRQVQPRHATAIAEAWKTALEKEIRLMSTAMSNVPQRFPDYLDSEVTVHAVTLIYGAAPGEPWSQFFSVSDEPLNKRLTRTLLWSTVSLCDTLKVLHAKQFAHRLLTPDKIFLTGGRPALLQDPGLATWKYEIGEGPELYQAPEQKGSHRNLPDPRTDVYQLGMILYHFITGKLPVSARQVLPLRTWNSELSVEIDAVLQRAIAFNLTERWRNAADFSSALKRVL